MTTSPHIPVLGGRSLWFWAALSFLAHLGLVWLLGERPVPPIANQDAFRTVLAENAASLAARLPDYDDPQLFALPSGQGFSGAGWLRVEAPPHTFYEWLDEQRWLPLRVEMLGQTFVEYVRLSTKPSPPMPRKVEPILPSLVSDLTMDWAPAQSRLRLEGPAARRLVPPCPQPPLFIHKDVLKPSIAELWVDERGRVFTAAIVQESGLPAADEAALDLARQLQFQPAPADGLSAGHLIVEWMVQPSTNSLPSPLGPAVP